MWYLTVSYQIERRISEVDKMRKELMQKSRNLYTFPEESLLKVTVLGIIFSFARYQDHNIQMTSKITDISNE